MAAVTVWLQITPVMLAVLAAVALMAYLAEQELQVKETLGGKVRQILHFLAQAAVARERLAALWEVAHPYRALVARERQVAYLDRLQLMQAAVVVVAVPQELLERVAQAVVVRVVLVAQVPSVEPRTLAEVGVAQEEQLVTAAQGLSSSATLAHNAGQAARSHHPAATRSTPSPAQAHTRHKEK